MTDFTTVKKGGFGMLKKILIGVVVLGGAALLYKGTRKKGIEDGSQDVETEATTE